MSENKSKLGFNETWSMAVGGMVGGGIFSTLGVVVSIAGAWAWLSFITAGLIALAAGYSYVKLGAYYGEGGGAFTFLQKVQATEFAGSLAWMLIAAYTLTNAVYAFTFGQYLGNVVGLGPWFPRTVAISIMGALVVLNLQGVSEAGGVEVVLVWFKLAVLVGLAAWGLAEWNPRMLSQGVTQSGIGGALFGGVAIFMAYEGFQLVSYAYQDIRNPQKTAPPAILTAIVFVIVVYVMVTLGTSMLIGASQVVKHKEVALAIAGRQALGTTGLIIVTIAAAFSTGSAINATLFATSRLTSQVAQSGELPAALAHENFTGIPDRAAIGLGTAAAVLAAVGSLTSLVEAASLEFLFVFTVVCGLAYLKRAGMRIATGFGAVSGTAAMIALVIRLIHKDPLGLALLGALAIAILLGRPFMLRHVKTESR